MTMRSKRRVKSHSYVMVIIMTFALFILMAVPSCRQRPATKVGHDGDTLKMKYSSLLHIVKYDQFTHVTIDNPWKANATLHQYVLVDRNQPIPPHLPQGTVIRIPLQKTVVFTSAHCKLMEWLGAQDQLSGVADLKYMLIDYVQQGVKEGKIADCGDGMNPIIEKIIQIHADALLISPFENSGGYGRVEDINIPIIECADYMENSALARAEWMRFYGLLLGKSHEADSLFSIVDSSYQKLKSIAQNAPHKTSIINEKLTGNTWYVPGGKSTVGQLISDANGTYAWINDNHGGSLPMTFETVLDKSGDADLWIFNYFGSGQLTYERLASEFKGYREMKAFKNHKVWYVDTQKVPYFEEVSFRPDYLLREYITLLHPELGVGNTKYYTPVSQ